MAILVAGGAGYIGSHMVKNLIEHGEDVTETQLTRRLSFTKVTSGTGSFWTKSLRTKTLPR